MPCAANSAGLLRANDENLPPTETIPSTETFVAFKGQVGGVCRSALCGSK